MSAIVIIQQTDAVHFITDGALYDEQGIMLAVQPKVDLLPFSNCMFSVRGGNYASRGLGPVLNLMPDLDAIASVLPEIISGIYEIGGLDGRADVLGSGRHFEVAIAGWSQTIQRWTAAIATTFERGDPLDPTGLSALEEYQQFMPFYAASLMALPGPDWSSVFERVPETQEDMDALDPAEIGLAVHKLQRERAGQTVSGDTQYLVGGMCQITTVSAEGLRQRTLCEWPDEIGQPIRPEGSELVEQVRARLAMAA